MGLSETIVAAIIGAIATMGTAIFQLIRNRAPSDCRPKPKKNRVRSVLATIALMIGCVVGGYAWSALRAVSAREDMRATMEAELTKQFAALRLNQTNAGTPGADDPADAEQREVDRSERALQRVSRSALEIRGEGRNRLAREDITRHRTPPSSGTVSAHRSAAKRGVPRRRALVYAAALPSDRSAFAISPSTALASPNTISVLSAV